ncbi:hypothetical protein [Zhongshania aquimaris]|uniref:Uncharacterized protein n=1 Tax=Zhongshania aquimaris TaxID=2857107 RepID=A0ABS6VS44_9GAMM|nr:hypothetical protein [Zhongshania aquimaris]MBW2940585.1 hypothetical protein [Zhongshania aquimaris]
MEIDTLICQIGDLEEAIRRHINTHRYQVDLLQDSSNWNQICSSLDVIGDTIYAIGSYEVSEFPKDSGLKYIYTYGLLQSLFLQQDALRHLSEAFDIQLSPSPILMEIRGIRNASIGHPTKQNQKGTRFHNYISRVSMSKHGFDLLRHSEHRSFDMINVDIQAMVGKQLAEVILGYTEIANRLAEADKMHKDRFKESRLRDVFPSAMGYFFEKIGQGIWAHSSGDREFGQANPRMLKETYENFQCAMEERNELGEYTKFDLDQYFHAIERVEGYLSGNSESMEEPDARIYWSYLRNEHEAFAKIAEEIDEQYQK